MPRPDIRQVRSAAVVLTLVLTACGRTDKAPASDSTRAAAPGAQRALVGATRSALSYPGALTKPIDQYSGDEFFALTDSLKYVGSHERERDCKDSPDCGGSGPKKKKTLVQVSAIATQDSLTAGNVPQFGVIYARAINKGDVEEARYGLRPGKTLRYYMIVHRDSAGALRWRLEEMETAKPRRHTQAGTGVFQSCGHDAQWTPGARADFKTCAGAERGDTVVTLPLVMQAYTDPMWSICGSGCCVY